MGLDCIHDSADSAEDLEVIFESAEEPNENLN
jgi:hypothetical protein